ncbi:hypothetical protein IM538_16985 [Cytobacillus suaedae]|nr:hypothetical protein IM538_16985 [Cytobacillus suaedae]
MAISEGLNQHRLKEILLNIYVQGMEKENIQLEEVIEEIRRELIQDPISLVKEE